MAQLATSPVSRRRERSASAPSARPALTLVARPQVARSSMPFTIVCTAVLLGALIAMLVLNISMSNTSYEITSLKVEAQKLSDKAQALQEKEQMLSTPQELERRATEIGMVPAGNVAYIDLNTGSVIGEAAVAEQGAETKLVPTGLISDGSVNIYDYGMGNERAH